MSRTLQLPGARRHALPARLYAPSHERLPLLLYLHGGGFVIGSLETHDSLCRQLALRSGGAVVALDYRLAPEHRFPAAVDDAWAALRWLADAARHRWAWTAAGWPSAATAPAARWPRWPRCMARDHGLPLALQLLITPGTAAHADTRVAPAVRQRLPARRGDDRLVLRPLHRPATTAATGASRRCYADDVDGVAPACVILAECDPLVDEGLAYADRLRAAGVPVAAGAVRGVTHDFIKMGRVLKEAGAAQAFAADALALPGSRHDRDP